jgi:hypothetical protein
MTQSLFESQSDKNIFLPEKKITSFPFRGSPPCGIGGCGSLIVATADSVVSSVLQRYVAF